MTTNAHIKDNDTLKIYMILYLMYTWYAKYVKYYIRLSVWKLNVGWTCWCKWNINKIWIMYMFQVNNTKWIKSSEEIYFFICNYVVIFQTFSYVLLQIFYFIFCSCEEICVIYKLVIKHLVKKFYTEHWHLKCL